MKFFEFPNRICNEIDLSGPRSSRGQKTMISLTETLKRIELSGHARQWPKINAFLFGILEEIKALGPRSSRGSKSMIIYMKSLMKLNCPDLSSRGPK